MNKWIPITIWTILVTLPLILIEGLLLVGFAVMSSESGLGCVPSEYSFLSGLCYVALPFLIIWSIGIIAINLYYRKKRGNEQERTQPSTFTDDLFE